MIQRRDSELPNWTLSNPHGFVFSACKAFLKNGKTGEEGDCGVMGGGDGLTAF